MIKYAGVNTLLPTPEVEGFISRYLDQEGMRFWNEPGHGPEIGAPAPVVPRLNWQKVFRPKLNQLIWPTGASRWASMLLLVTSEQLDDIKLQTDLSTSGVYRSVGKQLVIADATHQGTIEDDNFTLEELIPAEGETPALYGKSVALSTEMFALDARPVSLPYEYKYNSETEEWEWVLTTEKTLWLLPIVDKRWFGQWSDIGTDETWDDWDFAINSAAAILGSVDVSTVHASYFTPISDTPVNLEYANSCEVSDAAAHCVGQRIVRRIDGTVLSLTSTAAATAWNNNIDGDGSDAFSKWRRIAGGEFGALTRVAEAPQRVSATIPQKVRVQFKNDTALVSTEDAGATQWGINATTVTLYSYADLPTTISADEDYATQYATDMIGWLAKKADVVFAGVKAWRLTGFEDFVSWSVNTETGITTRVVTHPCNLAMLPIGGSSPVVDGVNAIIWTLAIRGNASAGTIDWEVELDTASDSGTWNFDDDHLDVKSSLLAFDASVYTKGGDLRWNVIKIKFSSPNARLRIVGQTLTRETYGIEPKAELASCYEPLVGWADE